MIYVKAEHSWKVQPFTVLLTDRPGEVSDQAAFIESGVSNAGHAGHPHNAHKIRAKPEGPARDGRLVRGHGEVTDECALSVILSCVGIAEYIPEAGVWAGSPGSRGWPRRGHGMRAVERVRADCDVSWPRYAAASKG